MMNAEEKMFSEVVELEQKKSENGVIFPTILTPNTNSLKPMVQLTQAITANKQWIESLLHKSGAILFRGFPVSTASDFNDVVDSSGYGSFAYGAVAAATRTKLTERVYTANESPPEQMIGFHHELAIVSDFPLKLFFFCEIEPGSGGETCIVLSHLIYDKMKQKHPEFVEQLEQKGLLYIRVLGKEFDPSSPAGRGWKAMFMTDDKSVAEERAAKLKMKLEWQENDVRVITGPMPGFRYDEARQRKVWFNSLAIMYSGIKDKLNDDPAKAVVFGDGEPLPLEKVDDLLKMLEEECFELKWQKGDVLLVDNMAVLHARRPLLAPPRRILASFCK